MAPKNFLEHFPGIKKFMGYPEGKKYRKNPEFWEFDIKLEEKIFKVFKFPMKISKFLDQIPKSHPEAKSAHTPLSKKKLISISMKKCLIFYTLKK